MKTKYLVALAIVALLPLISTFAQAPGPANLSPAAAEVVRLAGAGTSEDVVMAYVQNYQAPFNLSADHVLYLKDLGLPSGIVAAMLTHDTAMRAAAPPPAPEASGPVAAPVPMVAPAPAQEGPPPGPPAPAMATSTPPADVGYFYNDLAPYGAWVDMPGFGWCWQPTVLTATVGWTPYMHGGHWMNTDAGWFWSSDYSWGWAPFHYGRWYRHATAGWVWFPGRVWGPSWVVWRSGGDHCGWAPLPPHADFVAGVGWSFNGVHVSATFDFGLTAACFSFVGVGHFCDYNLRTYCLPATQVTTVYKNTTIINNVTYVNNTYVNKGINVNVFEKASGKKYEMVKVNEAHGGTSTGGAFRHPLGKPAPMNAMYAMKLDTKGHVPLGASSSAQFKSYMQSKQSAGAAGAGAGSGAKGNNTPYSRSTSGSQFQQTQGGDNKLHANPNLKYSTTAAGNDTQSGSSTGQKGNTYPSNLKPTGTTYDFSKDPKAHPGTGVNPNAKYSTLGGAGAGNAGQSGAGGSSGTSGSAYKPYSYQGSQNKPQLDSTSQFKQTHPGDVRGATSLTLHDNKGPGYSGSSGGAGTSGGNSHNTPSGNSAHTGGNNNPKNPSGSDKNTSGASGSGNNH